MRDFQPSGVQAHETTYYLARNIADGGVKMANQPRYPSSTGCAIQSGSNLFGTPKEITVHGAAWTGTQTLARERQRDIPQAAANRRLGHGPIDDVALRVTAADTPEVETNRLQQRHRLLMRTPMECHQSLYHRDADLAVTRRTLSAARCRLMRPA